MIFINNAIQKIGKDCLIVNLKAKNFFEGEGLRKEDFEQLFEVLKGDHNLNIPISKKNSLLLCVLYYEYDDNDEAKAMLKDLLLNPQSLGGQGCPYEDSLHLIFNEIEIEIKLRQKNTSELKMLFNRLVQFTENQKKFEDYLLLKHYFGYLKFLLKAYDETNNYTTDLIADIDEHKDLVISNLIKYIRIRNVLLKIKTLEITDPEKNNKDIISHLDCLFSLTKNTKEDFAICVGIKMLTLQSKEIVSYEECIKLIQEMLNILKRETLFGKSHKNILDQYLYLSGLLGYYNAINDDFEGVLKISKKIDKYLVNVQDIIHNIDNNEKEKVKNSINEGYSLFNKEKDEKAEYNNLYKQYQFFNTVLKSSVNFNSSAIKESQVNLQKYKNLNNQNETDLLNVCILEQDDIKMSRHFKNMEDQFKDWINKGVALNNDKIILCYFYLYNQISSLTKKVVEEQDDTKRLQYIAEARNFATQIIQNTGLQVEQRQNEFLKKVFRLPFFKNLFNRLFYVTIYSYFLEGKYEECLNKFANYDLYKIQYELDTPRSNAFMSKIKADCFFKQKKYDKAEEIYNTIVGMNINDPMVHFNLGISSYFNEKKAKAIAELEKAIELFKKDNNIRKMKIAEDILGKFKNEK
jgi:hypothetical protein